MVLCECKPILGAKYLSFEYIYCCYLEGSLVVNDVVNCDIRE